MKMDISPEFYSIDFGPKDFCRLFHEKLVQTESWKHSQENFTKLKCIYSRALLGALCVNVNYFIKLWKFI